MSLLFFDGFDDYVAAGASPDTAMLASGYARSGGSLASDNTPNGLGRSLRKRTSSQPTIVPAGQDVTQLFTGFHFISPDALVEVIANFYSENLLGTFRPQVTIIVNGQRGITVTNQLRTIVYGASDPALVSPGVFYFVEVKVDHVAGSVTVRLNNEVVVVAVLTLPFGTTNCVELPQVIDSRAGGDKFYDNLYILDGETGIAPYNDFLSEAYVFTAAPDADTGPNAFDIVGLGTDNFAVVDDGFVNDGDYLTTTTDGAQDWWSVANVPADTLEVFAVGIVHRTRKGAGPAQYRSLARIGATEVANATRSVSSTFSARMDIMTEKPGGGSWAVADANAFEIGIEAIAPV